MSWIMDIRKGKDNERPIQRVGLVSTGVREEGNARQGNEALQEVEGGSRSEEAQAVYNQTETGDPLLYPGKVSGRRKLRDEDVVRLRLNREQLSVNRWALIFRVTNAVIWNAMKGYTYKHLNWQHPPIR